MGIGQLSDLRKSSLFPRPQFSPVQTGGNIRQGQGPSYSLCLYS